MRTLLMAALVVVTSAGFAQDESMTPVQTERYHALVDELRCVICQNQSIAESNAPLAADMRTLVRRQIMEGRSDSEIRTFLVDRYGEWVLYRPPFQPTTWALWLGPAVLLAVALFTAAMLWRRAARRQAPPPPDRDSIARLLETERKRSG